MYLAKTGVGCLYDTLYFIHNSFAKLWGVRKDKKLPTLKCLATVGLEPTTYRLLD